MTDEGRVQALERALANGELERQALKEALENTQAQQVTDQRRIEALAARVTTLRAEISDAVQRLNREFDTFPSHVPEWSWDTLAGPVDRCYGVLHELLIAAGIESVRAPSVRRRPQEPAPAIVTVLPDHVSDRPDHSDHSDGLDVPAAPPEGDPPA